ncbi:MAG: Uma2 family endonuclease [Acidobacteria bacterium]|nr:Uma2 family endonuclease [Acidobacteriota bacterium]
MATPKAKLERRLRTVAEYLEFERQSEERHEFIDGVIRVMAGESPRHSNINANLIIEVGLRVKGTSCRVFSPNMKVRSGEQTIADSIKGLFSYPDLTVVCGQPQLHDKVGDVLTNPKVIFEVLSPSTSDFDRSEKFRRLRTFNESLTDYVLVWQTQPLIEHFERQATGQWLMTEVSGLENEFHIASINCRLKLSGIYDRVEFDLPNELAPEDSEEVTEPAGSDS